MTYRQNKSDIATIAGVTFANRARREAYLRLDKPPAGRKTLTREEELSAVEAFLSNKE